VVRRKTNRRHMTGDHHGRTSEKATLLVRAADEILGTHRTSNDNSAAVRSPVSHSCRRRRTIRPTAIRNSPADRDKSGERAKTVINS
jgi:hypothetical protein